MVAGLLCLFHDILNKCDLFFFFEHIAFLTSSWTGPVTLSKVLSCIVSISKA